MKRRSLIKLMGASGMTALLAPTLAARAAGTADELSVALAVNLPSLDPHFTTAVVTRQVAGHIYETLLTYDDGYNLAPMLAETFGTSDDGLVTSLTLRDGISFHNGKPLSAEDVIASIERWRGLSTVGKSAFAGVTEIRSPDGKTIEIISEAPSSALLEALASPIQAAAIMPKEIAEAAGGDEVVDIVGTGPYQLAEWRKDQFVLLSRFEDYAPLDAPASGLGGRKEALIKDIKFSFVTNAPSRIAGLQAGEYDFADDVPPDNYESLASDSALQVYLAKPSRQNIMFFNTKTGIFADKRVRLAVNQALDLDSVMLAAAARPDFFRIDPGLMFREQTSWYSDAGADSINLKDVEGGKAQLAAAGYNGEKVVILASREYQFLYRAALVIQQQLMMLGMNVDLQVYDWPTLLEKRRDPASWDIFFTFAGIYAHPTQITFIDSRKGYPGWYENAEVNALLDDLSATPDRARAKAMFNDIQTIYRGDVPTVKLGDMFALSASSTRVQDFDYFFDIHFWNVSLA